MAKDCEHCGMTISRAALQVLTPAPTRNYHASRSYCAKAARAAAKAVGEKPWNTHNNPLSNFFK